MRVSPPVQDGMPLAYHYHGTKGGADGAATAPFLNTAARRLQFDLLERSEEEEILHVRRHLCFYRKGTVYSGNAKLPVSI